MAVLGSHVWEPFKRVAGHDFLTCHTCGQVKKAEGGSDVEDDGS